MFTIWKSMNIRERFQPRKEADRVRQSRLWARDNRFVDAKDEEAARHILDQMEGRVRADPEKLDEELGKSQGGEGSRNLQPEPAH